MNLGGLPPCLSWGFIVLFPSFNETSGCPSSWRVASNYSLCVSKEDLLRNLHSYSIRSLIVLDGPGPSVSTTPPFFSEIITIDLCQATHFSMLHCYSWTFHTNIWGETVHKILSSSWETLWQAAQNSRKMHSRIIERLSGKGLSGSTLAQVPMATTQDHVRLLKIFSVPIFSHSHGKNVFSFIDGPMYQSVPNAACSVS